MPAINRKNLKLFAKQSSQNGVWGSAQSGSPQLSTDVETLQSGYWDNSYYSSVVSASNIPPIEELQTVNYCATYGLACIFQDGIPAYDPKTTYYDKSWVQDSTTGNIYVSVADNHKGQSLSDQSYWFLSHIPTGGENGDVGSYMMVQAPNPSNFIKAMASEEDVIFTNGYYETFQRKFTPNLYVSQRQLFTTTGSEFRVGSYQVELSKSTTLSEGAFPREGQDVVYFDQSLDNFGDGYGFSGGSATSARYSCHAGYKHTTSTGKTELNLMMYHPIVQRCLEIGVSGYQTQFQTVPRYGFVHFSQSSNFTSQPFDLISESTLTGFSMNIPINEWDRDA